MGAKRKRHSEEFKAKVALEAIKGVRTLSELSGMHGVHPAVIAQWKRQLVEGAAELFRRGAGATGKNERELTGPLYEEIGRLKVEVDWLKKKL
jgi:transposase-like protein